MPDLYNSYSAFLRSRFGCKVYRIGIDAAFTCPNRDGTRGYGGCHFCNEDGSRSNHIRPGESVQNQLSSGIAYLKSRFGAKKFIAYFQAFSNTHAPVSRLKEIYDSVILFDEIAGITIGTRPDTVDEEKARLIASYNDRYDVWIELGLQSANNKTLAAINRCHTYEDFAAAVGLMKRFGIPVCAHVILGLPGEGKTDAIETAACLNNLGVAGVKIHPLHILSGSVFEEWHRRGKITILAEDEYVKMVCNFLENLRPDMIIHRLTGQGSRDSHVAPGWALKKLDTIAKIRDELAARGSGQGSKIRS